MKTKDGEIKLLDNRIGISLSGGLDSAVGFYDLCETILAQNNNVIIKPLHYVDNMYPITESIVYNVIKLVKERYPDVNIEEPEIFKFDLKYVIYKNSWQIKNLKERNDLFDQRINDLGIKYVYNFLTMLPEPEVYRRWNLYYDFSPFRQSPKPEFVEKNGYISYHPWGHLTKRFVAEKFKELNVPESLVDDTRSCTEIRFTPINDMRPCNACYHCWEKKWAFGKL